MYLCTYVVLESCDAAVVASNMNDHSWVINDTKSLYPMYVYMSALYLHRFSSLARLCKYFRHSALLMAIVYSLTTQLLALVFLKSYCITLSVWGEIIISEYKLQNDLVKFSRMLTKLQNNPEFKLQDFEHTIECIRNIVAQVSCMYIFNYKS